ncbi:MAG: AsmA family protein, partial [Desulfobacterales bacterium]
TATDPSAIEPMVDVSLPRLGPLAINGRLNANRQNVAFKGNTRIGETDLKSTVSIGFSDSRPVIDARLAATVVNLKDMGIYPEAPPETSAAASQTKPQQSERLFDDTPLPLDALKTVDLFFALDADKLVARHITINDLDLDIRLDNGRLRIHPARLFYAAGFTEVEAIVDASGSTPEFFLKITGEDIDIDDLLAHLHRPMILSGALTVVVDLESAGSSVREIAANLNGEFSLALENGRIRRIVDLLSADAFDLVFSAADRRKYTDLQCLVNKMKFEKGVGNIELFSMDTPKTRVGAAGQINLVDERIDVAIQPEKKRRLLKGGSAVQIKGPLTKPAVRTLPSKEAAVLYGKIVMPYVFLPARALGSLLGLVQNDKDATACVFE